MDNGWIKIYRKLLEWEWFNDSKTLHVFIYLLIKANHVNKKWRGVDIRRGQVLTGRLRISEQTGLSERKVRTALANLELTGEVTIKATSRNSIVTICNYETFQHKETHGDQQNDQQTTNERPADDQQTTTTKNERTEELKKQPKTVARFAPPEWINTESWESFVDMRKKIKAPLTDRAIKLLIGKLEGFIAQGYDANEILDNSTMNCWKGVFAESIKGKSGPVTFEAQRVANTKQAMIDFVKGGNDDRAGQNRICDADGGAIDCVSLGYKPGG